MAQTTLRNAELSHKRDLKKKGEIGCWQQIWPSQHEWLKSLVPFHASPMPPWVSEGLMNHVFINIHNMTGFIISKVCETGRDAAFWRIHSISKTYHEWITDLALIFPARNTEIANVCYKMRNIHKTKISQWLGRLAMFLDTKIL